MDINKIIPDILKDPYKFANSISIQKLVDILTQLSYYYYNTDEPLISDSIYDLLIFVLEDRDPSNIYLQQIGCPISKNQVDLPFVMTSLNKIKPNTNYLNVWKKKYIGPYVISDKLDGVSGLLHKLNGKLHLYTRGDSITGQDITHLIPYIFNNNTYKIKNDCAVRGELIISKSNFNKIKDKYKNARNTVAGLVNSINFSMEIASLTDFIAYAIIHPKIKQDIQMKKLIKWNFPVVNYKIEVDLNNDWLCNYLQERRIECNYNIDGIVIVDSSQAYDLTNKNPNYGFAFKMILSDQIVETDVLDVKWNITMHGYLKPIIIIKPVNLLGVCIKKATAFNAKFIIDNKLGPGAIIKILRSGDVIPHILEVLKPASSGKPKLPDIPFKWNKTGIDIIVNDINGFAQNFIIIKKLMHFFKVLGVKYISKGIITKLVENDYKSIEDILSSDINELAKIPGIGPKILNKIFDNIKNSFETTNLETLMAASNIFGRGLGIKKLKIITDAFPNIINKKYDIKILEKKILELNGFDKITANLFITGLDEFKKFFTRLTKINTINVSHLKFKKSDKIINKNKFFENQKIVLTGFRNKEIENFIIENCGEINNSISKKTSLLITKINDSNSSKYIKAISLNIPIMTIDEFKIKYKL